MQLPIILSCFFCYFGLQSSSAQEIPDSLLQSSDAVILYQDYSVKFEKYNKYVLEYKKSTKILNKRADHLQKLYFHFKEGSEKLSDIQISVLDANGDLIQKVKSKDIKEYASGDGYSIVSDQRTKYWSCNTNTYPITINCSYKKESKNTLVLPIWAPLPSKDISILESHYTVQSAASLRTKELNLDRYPTIEKIGPKYSIKNQKSLQSERYTPSHYEVLPYVIISPYKFAYEGIDGSYDNWEDYGKWMYESFIADKKLPKIEELKSELTGIIKPNDSEEDIIKKVYDFVQQNTRYISISLDEGGFNPMDPAKVHEVKYGDCKALSLYTKTILNAYNIPANYTEIHADRQIPQDLFSDYASALPGNHIILNIPLEQDTVWLECTSHSNPYNFLGTGTDNRQAVSIEATGGKLVHTPIYASNQNSIHDSIFLSIDKSGESLVEINTISRGLAMQADLHFFYKSLKEKEKHFEEDIYNKIKIRKINNIEIELDEDTFESTKRLKFELGTYAEVSGNYIFVPKAVAPINIPKLKKDKNRVNEIYFPRGKEHRSTMTIAYDSELDLVENPSLLVDTKYGSYKCTISKSINGQHQVSREFILKAGRYPAKEYNKIKSFFDQGIKAEQTPITLMKI